MVVTDQLHQEYSRRLERHANRGGGRSREDGRVMVWSRRTIGARHVVAGSKSTSSQVFVQYPCGNLHIVHTTSRSGSKVDTVNHATERPVRSFDLDRETTDQDGC